MPTPVLQRRSILTTNRTPDSPATLQRMSNYAQEQLIDVSPSDITAGKVRPRLPRPRFHQRRMHLYLTLCAATLSAILIISLSGARHPPTTAPRGGSRPTAGSTVPTTIATPTTTRMPTTSAPSRHAPGCKTAQLRVSLQGPFEASGTAMYVATLSNVGSTDCALHGYPKVILRDRSGNVVARFEPHVSVMMLSNPPLPGNVILAANGGRAQFRFGGIDWIPEANNGKGGACPSASEAIITPPGAKTPAKVSDRFFLCSGGVEAITSYGWQP